MMVTFTALLIGLCIRSSQGQILLKCALNACPISHLPSSGNGYRTCPNTFIPDSDPFVSGSSQFANTESGRGEDRCARTTADNEFNSDTFTSTYSEVGVCTIYQNENRISNTLDFSSIAYFALNESSSFYENPGETVFLGNGSRIQLSYMSASDCFGGLTSTTTAESSATLSTTSTTSSTSLLTTATERPTTTMTTTEEQTPTTTTSEVPNSSSTTSEEPTTLATTTQESTTTTNESTTMTFTSSTSLSAVSATSPTTPSPTATSTTSSTLSCSKRPRYSRKSSATTSPHSTGYPRPTYKRTTTRHYAY